METLKIIIKSVGVAPDDVLHTKLKILGKKKNLRKCFLRGGIRC